MVEERVLRAMSMSDRAGGKKEIRPLPPRCPWRKKRQLEDAAELLRETEVRRRAPLSAGGEVTCEWRTEKLHGDSWRSRSRNAKKTARRSDAGLKKARRVLTAPNQRAPPLRQQADLKQTPEAKLKTGKLKPAEPWARGQRNHEVVD